MPFPNTGSNTELQAVNQILASVGQAPVNTLTTEEILVVTEVSRFTGYISGTTLTTETSDIEVGTFISGLGVANNTSVATAAVEATPATDPVTYEYTVNISQTIGDVNNYFSLSRAVVTKKVETQTNPDVAIALNTLNEVSREVQAEGWSFNKEYDYPVVPNSNKEVIIANDVLQMDLNKNYTQNMDRDAIYRNGKLYDKTAHSYTWTDEKLYVDIIWYMSWDSIPTPIQAFIVARAASIVSSRIIGDGNQFQMLSQKEAFTRSTALEYECNQSDYTFFGSPKGGNFYQSYEPFHALQR